MVPWLLLAGILVLAGCRAEGPGEDSKVLLYPNDSSPVEEPFCVGCHLDNDVINPRLINGESTDGKHILHLDFFGNICLRCHGDYYKSDTHGPDGLGADDPGVVLVLFDQEKEPDAVWQNDTGAGTGSCANVSCHPSATPEWYRP